MLKTDKNDTLIVEIDQQIRKLSRYLKYFFKVLRISVCEFHVRVDVREFKRGRSACKSVYQCLCTDGEEQIHSFH